MVLGSGQSEFREVIKMTDDAYCEDRAKNTLTALNTAKDNDRLSILKALINRVYEDGFQDGHNTAEEDKV